MEITKLLPEMVFFKKVISVKFFIRTFVISCYFSVLSIAQAAPAWVAVPRASVSLGGSTLGAGAGVGFHDHGALFGVRLGTNLFRLGLGVMDDDARTRVLCHLHSESILLDVYPWRRNFRLTAGVIFNQNRATVTSRPYATSALLGYVRRMQYQGAIGEVSGPVTFNQVDPYIGLGVDFDFGPHWTVSVDGGAMYEGNGHVSLTPSGLLATDPRMRAGVTASALKAERAIGRLSFYPVVGLAISYRF
jgi:hypothetical protein